MRSRSTATNVICPGARSAVWATGTKPSAGAFIPLNRRGPSPASREREGPTPEGWEGEGLSVADTLTRLAYARHPLPRCGRGARWSVQFELEHPGGVFRCDLPHIAIGHAIEHALDELLRARERRLGMRVVA